LYLLLHCLDILEYLMIPKSQDTKSLCFQAGATFGIRGSLGAMLSTVQLDDESCLKADKVNDVWSYWLLSTKFMSVELAQAEMTP
jgi:hypothetical protein